MNKKIKLFLLIMVILCIFVIRVEGVYMVDDETNEREFKKTIYYENIPITIEGQYYIYKESMKNNVSYEMILAMMKLESNFKNDIISKTNDYGIMQINKKYADWYGELANLTEYDLTDFKDNVRMGISGIAFYCDFYRDKGMSEELIFYYALNSYNMGINGYKQYVSNNTNISRAYDRRILDYKMILERRKYE